MIAKSVIIVVKTLLKKIELTIWLSSGRLKERGLQRKGCRFETRFCH